MTPREERIGEETVAAIDMFSRLLGAIESGDWYYAKEKLHQLQQVLPRLRAQLDRTTPAAGPPVKAFVAHESRHYRIGKALYEPPARLTDVERAEARANLSDLECRGLLAWMQGRWPARYDELLAGGLAFFESTRTEQERLEALARVANARAAGQTEGGEA